MYRLNSGNDDQFRTIAVRKPIESRPPF